MFQDSYKKFITAFIALILFIIMGVLGYKYLIGSDISYLDSLYMTIITISTVGFAEVVDLGRYPGARLFTIFLIFLGMGNLLFIISAVTSIFVEGYIEELFWKKKVKYMIKKLKDFTIVCGAGRTGHYIVEELYKTKQVFVVIEKNEKTVEELRKKFPEIILIKGDATSDDVLEKAGVKKAKSIICTLEEDKDNIFLVLTANHLNNRLKTIAKVINVENESKMKMAGANYCVFPQYIGALRLVSELVRPEVVSFIDDMLRENAEYRIESFSVKEKSQLLNKKLKDLKNIQKLGINIIAIKNKFTGDSNYNPSGNTRVLEGDTIFTICTPKQRIKIEQSLN